LTSLERVGEVYETEHLVTNFEFGAVWVDDFSSQVALCDSLEKRVRDELHRIIPTRTDHQYGFSSTGNHGSHWVECSSLNFDEDFSRWNLGRHWSVGVEDKGFCGFASAHNMPIAILVG